MDQLTIQSIIAKYIVAIVGGILVYWLRRAIKGFESLADTRMKAELAFEEVSEREPKYKQVYHAWQKAR